MQPTVKPMFLEIKPDYILVDILGTEYQLSYQSWDSIRNLNFYYDPKRKNQKYPQAYNKSKGTQHVSLPTIIFGIRCYTVSSDYKDLRLDNLTPTCKIETIEPGLIKVWIGNGKYFITDEEFSDYVKSYKWTQIQLKNGYPYICRQTGDGLELFHRYVSGATEPDQHVDHIDWNTINNTKSNLQILSMVENIKRWNPTKVARRFAQ